MSEVKSTGKISVVTIVLLILLLASIGGNIFQFFNTRQIIVEKEKTILQVDSIAILKATLEVEYNNAVKEIEQYKGQSEQLDSLLKVANEKLEAQRKKIAYLIDQNEGYDILKQRYAELDQMKEGFLQEIQQLKEQNALLRAENVELQVKVDQTQERATTLQGKVDIGARLKMNSILLKAFNLKASGKAVETDKANKADRIAITFTVDDNPLAEEGPRQLYVRILDPAGFCLADVSKTIRKFTNDKGEEVPYSRNFEINYKGQKITQTLNYDNGNIKPGTYGVEIYIDSYFAGRNQITVK